MHKYLYLLLLFGLIGCSDSSHEVSYRNNTNTQQLTLTTPQGERIDVLLTKDIAPELLIALNTLLANHQIQIITQEREVLRQQTNLSMVTYAFAAICLICGTVVTTSYFLRKR